MRSATALSLVPRNSQTNERKDVGRRTHIQASLVGETGGQREMVSRPFPITAGETSERKCGDQEQIDGEKIWEQRKRLDHKSEERDHEELKKVMHEPSRLTR